MRELERNSITSSIPSNVQLRVSLKRVQSLFLLRLGALQLVGTLWAAKKACQLNFSKRLHFRSNGSIKTWNAFQSNIRTVFFKFIEESAVEVLK